MLFIFGVQIGNITFIIFSIAYIRLSNKYIFERIVVIFVCMPYSMMIFRCYILCHNIMRAYSMGGQLALIVLSHYGTVGRPSGQSE